jgi:hypothetical protein
VNDLLMAIGQYLRTHEQLVRVDELHANLGGHDQLDIDYALHLLRQADLIRSTFQGDRVQITPDGRAAVDDNAVLALALGPDYIFESCSAGTVHIIVRGENREESGGSGFFCGDYPGWIVTAAHVISGREILRIEDQNGAVISDAPRETLIARNEVDIGAVRCPSPQNATALRIEWNQQFIRTMGALVVLGYPPYPGHHPALHHATAELHSKPKRLGSDLVSLIIASVTRPGFSGGPVLNERGRVIGIVEQENTLERENQHPIAYFSAIPAEYSRYVAFPNEARL